MTVAEPAAASRAPPAQRAWQIVRWLAVLALLISFVVFLWNQGERFINGETSGAVCYLIVIALVFGDALIPVLPGETTLNAAVLLAVSGKLELPLIVICGAVGAIAGDSTLYWLSRTAHGRARRWLDRAADGKASSTAVDMLDKHGRLFLLFGRYVPGLRFALNVVLGGIVRMPYRTFIRWSALSGTLWSAWVCVSAYYISSALAGYPLAALVVSTFAGTVLIGSIIWAQSRLARRRSAQPAA